MSIAFTQQVQQSRGGQIYLMHGGQDADGRPAWYFIQVESTKLRAFQKAVADGAINLDEFGAVLECGFAKAPPHSVVQRMRDEYGYTG